jgi:L-ascorbate metabolism protein UlaG (beta-lactamase superfamily)
MSALAVTRLVNASVLLDFDGDVVLTDPWFDEHWYLHRGEPLGCTVDDLPRLTAIVGSNGFVNHWDVRALARDPSRLGVPVIACSARMARTARAAGFTDVRLMGAGDDRRLSDRVRLEAVDAGGGRARHTRNYVFTTPDVRVFFGGEARLTAPIEEYGRTHDPIDVAVLPVSGLRVAGGPQLVMNAPTAIACSSALGAATLVPVHDAEADELVWRMLRRDSVAADAVERAAATDPALDVVALPTGRRWEWPVSAGRGRSCGSTPGAPARRDRRRG